MDTFITEPGTVLYAEALFDGVATIPELIERLDRTANWLRTLEHDGWSFEGPELTEGAATLVDPNGNVTCFVCRETLVPAHGTGECADCARR